MSNFDFQAPSIHNVLGITARAQVFKSGGLEVACLHVSFHGARGETKEIEAFFPANRTQNAIATAAAINAVSGLKVDDEAEAA